MAEKILESLGAIQAELKAPKGQRNTFGNYNYRSCEDILEAVKPLLKQNECTLTISDEVLLIGDRFYIKATAEIRSAETGESVSVSAFAREQSSKKGMDEAQVTGAASSYARKYALNGLFCIDDTKDPDTYEKSAGTAEISCPKCGNIVRAQKKKTGDKVVTISPADVLRGCGGICYDCYKAERG